MRGPNLEVLDFYRRMPFNLHASPERAARAVKKNDPISAYPFLESALAPGRRVLDVGCGAGWFVNGLTCHRRAQALGIDFNGVAIRFAREVAAVLDAPAVFEEADLFAWAPQRPFDLVVSLGVLHHTDDCHEGIRRCVGEFLAPGGRALIGLYHAAGRAPFLRRFQALRQGGASEEEMFEAFKTLFRNSSDETMQRSWFRDQVLHPRETYHTLSEVWPLVEAKGCRLLACSIDGFAPGPEVERLIANEGVLERVGEERLAEGRYYPGYFLIYIEKQAV